MVNTERHLIEYVCGFLFSPDKQFVILIRKSKPKWQEGLFNGVGGKVESTDINIPHAMHREFLEETGLNILPDAWNWFATYIDKGNTSGYPGKVYMLRAVSERYTDVQTMEDEQVRICDVNIAQSNSSLPNLTYMIPLALYPIKCRPVIVEEV